MYAVWTKTESCMNQYSLRGMGKVSVSTNHTKISQNSVGPPPRSATVMTERDCYIDAQTGR